MEQEDLLKLVQNLKDLSSQRRENLLQKNNGQPLNSYKCSICKDTGWIRKVDEEGRAVFAPCECREKKKTKNQWKASGMDLNTAKLTFKNFKGWNESSKLIKNTGISYFNDFVKIRSSRNNSIIFCGQPGSGKTHIAVALGMNFIKKGFKVMYMPYRDMMTKLKQKICDDKGYNESLAKLKNCDILLIDDLFKGKVTEADLNIIFEIVNFRYLNYLPIMVSSELMMEEILSLDEGIGSRIYDMCKKYMDCVKRDVKNNYRLV